MAFDTNPTSPDRSVGVSPDTPDARLPADASPQAPTEFEPAPSQRELRAPVFIGFDAEWVDLRRGRNRLLSVQLPRARPTGKR